LYIRSIDHLIKYKPLFLRSIVYSILLSHSVRHDCKLISFVEERKRYTVILGSRVKRIYPDEQSLQGVFNKMLRSLRAESLTKKKIHPGVFIYNGDFVTLLKEERKRENRYVEEGRMRTIPKLCREFTIVVPFIHSFTRKERDIMKQYNYRPLKIGLDKLYPDQLIAVLNFLGDREG